MTNYEEYIAGTDPTDAASYLHINATAAIPGGGAILSFIAVSNRTYSVLYRDNVGAGSWQRWTNISPSAPINRVLVLTNAPAAVGKRFYRLVTPQAP